MTADYANAATEPEDDDSPLAARNWPDLNPAVFQGRCGRIVNEIMPYTEADPAAVIVTLLATVGCMLGRSVRALAGNDDHPARLWPLICGRTSDGAKGTSWSAVRTIIDQADSNFLANHMEGGIVSGEGVIELVRDESGDDPDANNYDPGVPDKRLLIVEPEFASVLAKGSRQGSSLMQILREAWDGSPLRSAARKSNKLRATDPHITLIGHVTPGEFLSKLTSGEVDGGTVNRMLLILSRRSKELPDGGNLPADVRDRCALMIEGAVALGRVNEPMMSRTTEAAQLWREVYPSLVAPKPDGWFASVTARAQAQVLRLSVAYAALDASPVIDVDHLKAALALWEYAEASARVLFAEVGYEKRRDDTDKILAFIGEHGRVTRNQIREKLYQRNKSSAEIDALLKPLIESGLIIQDEVQTRGRPKTVYSLRGKRGNARSTPTSENSEGLSALPRNGTRKVSDENGKVRGHTAYTAYTASAGNEQPPGAPTDKTPGMTTEVERALASARNRGRVNGDPPCVHCGDPCSGKQKDDAGRYAHLSCQQNLKESA